MDSDVLERAATVIHDGELVVYPTETVYGLGADALTPAAVERVFSIKGRDRSKPISLAVPRFDVALEEGYVRATDRERRFAAEFLPGPVTLLCERRARVPGVLTADRDRVGVRVPDCNRALSLLERLDTPITSTSANVSGEPSARRVEDIDESVRNAAVVLDGGQTPGTESTVVDLSTETIHRRGSKADRIDAWLTDN
ncbi:threonylcarbamoyl-AMP synthase [Natrarchaeobius halalkaliphilus]|uniref:L-threonylcarbamoyladenylate synthase n=1 Tax=Natrarchaeobius halalkaliphilus TaxID=1679091 RepID=A0A3N6PA93_9EURY|nr:L-threonylcarbamoyladenylate synthase [Natrarchaeobius halalkaliphilus]RQG93275.1 threonylcarbamoyl-AMP synthase [Natrarchaeobius halalkaliphilus]